MIKTKFNAQIDMISIEGLTDTKDDMTVVEVEFDHVPTAVELQTSIKKAFKDRIGIAPYDDVFDGECAVALVNMVEPYDDHLGFLDEIEDKNIMFDDKQAQGLI